jgi:hypothetical protein
MSSRKRIREVWIGLIEVYHRPGAGVLMDQNAAFTNGLAFASDEREYVEAVREALANLGFDVTAVEDVEPLSTRRANRDVDKGLLELAVEVARSGAPRFGTFHVWVNDDK